MKLFSIQQGAYALSTEPDTEKTDAPNRDVVLQFGEDPHNSAIVRLRLLPPGAQREGGNAIEVEFNRSGGIVSQTLQPTAFVAWDRRPVEEQQKDADERHRLANTPSEVQSSDDPDGDAGAGDGGNQKAGKKKQGDAQPTA